MAVGLLSFGRVFWAELVLPWGSYGLLVPGECFLLLLFVCFILTKGMLIDFRERRREGERNPDWGPNPQPKHVP